MTITIESLEPIPKGHRVVSVVATGKWLAKKQFRPRRTRRLMERDVIMWLHETYGHKTRHLNTPLVITVKATLVTPTFKESLLDLSRITAVTKED